MVIGVPPELDAAMDIFTSTVPERELDAFVTTLSDS